MMVRFYVLKSSHDKARIQFVCRLCEKAQQSGKKTTVLCDSESVAEQLDQALWLMGPESFLPHCRLEDALAEKAAVLIAVSPERGPSSEVLINLSLDEKVNIPAGCEKVFEVVNQNPSVVSSSRERYRYYQAQGITPETVRLEKA